jgi:hypothetical protein
MDVIVQVAIDALLRRVAVALLRLVTIHARGLTV